MTAFIQMKKWDLYLALTGFVGTMTLERAIAVTVGVLTIVLLFLRIYVMWKHRNTPPKGD